MVDMLNSYTLFLDSLLQQQPSLILLDGVSNMDQMKTSSSIKTISFAKPFKHVYYTYICWQLKAQKYNYNSTHTGRPTIGVADILKERVT